MSPLMIILLILILSFRSSQSNNSKRYDNLERNDHFNEKNYRNFSLIFNEKKDRNFSLNDRVNYVDSNGSSYNRDYTRIKMEKLRHDLRHLMSTMLKRIIQQRRSKIVKKWEHRRDGKNAKLDEIMGEKKMSIVEFPVNNNLERGTNDVRDGKDYNDIIGQTRDVYDDGNSSDIYRVSKTLVSPLVRGNLRSRIRKVWPNFESIKRRINRVNESETGETRKRWKRANDEAADAWIKKDFKDHEESFKMNVLVVRDEDIPPCCTTAKEVTNQRYFMCSGAVLTLKHAITTASCMHFADIYSHKVDADLGILVGPTNPRAYVIKINRYEMHPDYDYDVDSKNYAMNNIAVIYLECSIIAQEVVIPSLPKGINDDVAHMCCREGCDLITIVQSYDNRHTARIIKARNLPAPRHDDEAPNYREFSSGRREIPQLINKQSIANQTFVKSRGIRSPLRLAAAPIFYGKEPRGTSRNRSSAKNVDPSAAMKRRKAKTLEKSRARNEQRTGRKNDQLNIDDFMGGGNSQDTQIPILRALVKQGVNVEEQLAAVNWEQIEETMSNNFSDDNREVMEVFAKDVVDETMKRLETVLGDEDSSDPSGPKSSEGVDNVLGNGNGSAIFSKLMPSVKKNQTISSFVKVFTKVVASLVPPNSVETIAVSSDSTLEEKDLVDPPPIYVDCPPLGAPVITDGILVGLVAYTCDDLQNWVEWKYVNIAKNINWIREKMLQYYEPPGKCSDTKEKPAPQVRSLSEVRDNVSFDRNSWMENETVTRDRNIEWRRRDIASEKIDDFPRNFDSAEIPMREMSHGIVKDSWYARNSRLAPKENSNDRGFANSRNRPKISILRNVPVYKVNTCYVKADGTTDCETRTQFNLR